MPSLRPHPAPGQAGFTIIETMVAAVVLLVGLVATLTLVEQASSVTVKTRTREQATNLQRELVEAARSLSYDQLTPNGVGAAIRTRPALGDSSVSGAGWTIRRRNATYTVAVGVCTVDDPGDGIGAHEAGTFCGTAAAPIDANSDGTVDGLASTSATTCASPCPDTNAADYKRVVSLVRWPAGSNQQTSQVNNPGSAAAPAVTVLEARGLTPPTYTIKNATSQTLTSTTTGAPRTVALYRDGTQIGTATSSGGADWSATWPLGIVSSALGAQPGLSEVVDGSYELSEKAFDQYGQHGAIRSQSIVLNRRRPFAAARVEAGRNAGAVEIEWSPAKERDSEGFRVDRTTGSTTVTVCALAVRTSCRDNAPPAPGSSPTYKVIGVDRDPDTTAQRDGDPAAFVLTDPAPAAPASPGTLQASVVSGNVVLTWTAPTGGVAPDHYNLYRDGQAYGDRLDSVYVEAGQPLTYTDSQTTGQVHDYWITAVNANLGESTQLGPVRR